nr:pentatricopeptide repeat-containing protein At3g57430, chloroplastic [Ipomoea batatas]
MNRLAPVTNRCTSRQNRTLLNFQISRDSNSNEHSYASTLKLLKRREHIQEIHASIVTSGLCRNIFLCNSLLNSYVRCGLLADAQKLFSRVVGKNLVSWTILISGFVKNGHFVEATEAFLEMIVYGLRPNEITISSILPAFGELGLTLTGKSVHCYWIRQNFGKNVYVETALVDMYSKMGRPISARHIFDNMSERNSVSWNAMLSAYSDNGFGVEAIQLFSLMRRERISADALTIMSLISASSIAGNMQIMSGVHALAVRLGCEDDLVKTALMDMYINLGCIGDAHCLFLEISKRDVVAWTLMLTGFSRIGNWNKTIQYFNMMMGVEEIVLDSVCLTSIVSCCSCWGALQQGRGVHALAVKTGCEADVFLGSAIISMYANCANLDDAKRFFGAMSRKDVACWNAMIAGTAMHGYGNAAIELFMKMESAGIAPNESTLVSVLSACSQAGMVDKGLEIFNSMVESWNVVPNQKHYACVVGLLGRAGRLDDAYSIISEIHLQPGVEVYCALLGACKAHGNIELGIKISERLFELNPDDAGYYVLLSNMYAFLGNQEGVKLTRLLLRSKNLKKDPGLSLIEINGEVYRFMASEKDHPLYPEISEFLKGVILKIEAEGYVADMNCVFQDVPDFVKRDILYHHSEKLAIALGLMRTKPGTMLRVTKNLRICNDCHSASKFISKVFGRKLIIKDANFFHMFQDGICSCRDFW